MEARDEAERVPDNHVDISGWTEGQELQVAGNYSHRLLARRESEKSGGDQQPTEVHHGVQVQR